VRTAAILPVKRFSAAKQRLGQSVADGLRAALAHAMVGDVLSALRDCAAIHTTIVVTCEPAVAAAARYLGAIAVEDTAESGQSAAVSIGLQRALAEGFERALCIPGDCPALDPEELGLLLALDLAPPTEVTIIPDRHGTGTNGLLLSLPSAIEPSFGSDSRARHERLAHSAGVACRIERLPSLLLDVDTGEDLAALRERLVDEQVRAPRTRAVLDRFQRHGDATASAAARA
jgi:2-phospho-L-lactate/phosphoenolpyruvate guanylyltransferase